ncbi:MAG: type IV secretion system protein [Haemophilus parainfluenzae]
MNPLNVFDTLRKAMRGAADATLYSSIRNYFSARIEYFMENTLSNNISLALTMVGALFTFWIMVQGYLILTGRSQDSLKAFVFNVGKTYIIILVALGVSSTSEFALRNLTKVTTDGVASLMMGENENSDEISKCLMKATSSILGCQIDQNLITAQAVMAFINQIDTADNARLSEQVEQAKLFAGVGTAGPGIVTGTMLILYRVAMALFIGFSPFFILCLMFKKTTPYFTKWLNYGLATIFSSVLLAVMAGICTDLVEIIARRQFANDAVFTALGIDNSGVFQAAMNQLGLGLMMSTVLILCHLWLGLGLMG